ncbi:MAG: PAS domain S-box protein, partial [Pseudomonadota bacterium]
MRERAEMEDSIDSALAWRGEASGRLSVLQRNELLEMAEEVASVGHWMVDLENGSLFWSDEVYRIHGVDPQQYAPDVESAIDFYHPEDATRVAGLLDKAISDRQPYNFELRLVRSDGELRLVRARARVRVDDNDVVVAVFGTFQDVTEQHRNETFRRDLLAWSTSEGLSVGEKLSGLLLLGRRYVGADVAFVEAENAGERRLAFAEDDRGVLTTGRSLVGAPLVPISGTRPEPLLDLADYLGRANAWLGGNDEPLRSGLGLTLRVNEKPYGSVWFASRDAIPERMNKAETGLLAELAQVISYELGARERTSELVDTARAFRQKQRELDLILDTVPTRIWYKDNNNRILMLNAEAARSMGMSREEAEGANSAELFPKMAEKYLADDRAVIASGKPRYGIIERYAPRDGEEGWVSTDKIPFVDTQTGQPRILAVATDITHMMAVQKSLEQQTEALQRSNRDL